MAGSAGPAVGGGSGARRPRRPLRRPRQARGNADPGTTVVPRGSNTMSGPRERRPGKDPTTQTGPRGSRPPPDPTGTPPTLRERVGFQSNAQTGGTRSTRNLRARGRMTGRGRRTGRRTRPPRRPHPGRLFWGVRVGLVGLLGRPGAGSCPNLPQRRPWGQVVFAPLMMSLIFSAGVCPFKTRRGRRLRRSWTAWTWASVTSVT